MRLSELFHHASIDDRKIGKFALVLFCSVLHIAAAKWTKQAFEESKLCANTFLMACIFLLQFHQCLKFFIRTYAIISQYVITIVGDVRPTMTTTFSGSERKGLQRNTKEYVINISSIGSRRFFISSKKLLVMLFVVVHSYDSFTSAYNRNAHVNDKFCSVTLYKYRRTYSERSPHITMAKQKHCSYSKNSIWILADLLVANVHCLTRLITKYDRFSCDCGYEARPNLIKEFAHNRNVWKKRISYNTSNRMNPTDRKQIIMYFKCFVFLSICRHYRNVLWI